MPKCGSSVGRWASNNKGLDHYDENQSSLVFGTLCNRCSPGFGRDLPRCGGTNPGQSR